MTRTGSLSYGEIYNNALESGFKRSRLGALRTHLEAEGFKVEIGDSAVKIGVPSGVEVVSRRYKENSLTKPYWFTKKNRALMKIDFPKSVEVRFFRKSN